MKSIFILSIALLISTPLAAFAQANDGFFGLPQELVLASQSGLHNTSGEEVDHILVDQQVQIVADVTNALDRQQSFAYIVQIQDDSGVTVSLGWLTGSLSPNQILSPALSWTPKNPGVYLATVFVWEGIANPTALSPTLSIEIDVRQSPSS